MDKILARDCIPASASWCTSPPTPPWWVPAYWPVQIRVALAAAAVALCLLLIRAVWQRGRS